MIEISPGRIWTYDQSINSRPLCHWATEELEIPARPLNKEENGIKNYEMVVSGIPVEISVGISVGNLDT